MQTKARMTTVAAVNQKIAPGNPVVDVLHAAACWVAYSLPAVLPHSQPAPLDSKHCRLQACPGHACAHAWWNNACVSTSAATGKALPAAAPPCHDASARHALETACMTCAREPCACRNGCQHGDRSGGRAFGAPVKTHPTVGRCALPSSTPRAGARGKDACGSAHHAATASASPQPSPQRGVHGHEQLSQT